MQWRRGALPSYNFVNHQLPQLPRRPALDAIAATILHKWASHMEVLDRPTTTAKLWQALMQQAQPNGSVPYREAPNAVCTAIYFELLQEIFKATFAAGTTVCDLVLGGLLNSVYRTYDAAKPFYDNQLYSGASDRPSVSREERASQNDHHVRAMYLHFSQLESSSQKDVVRDLVKPVLTPDVVTELWGMYLDAPVATTLRLPTAAAVHAHTFQRCLDAFDDDEKKAIVLTLAAAVDLRVIDPAEPPKAPPLARSNSHRMATLLKVADVARVLPKAAVAPRRPSITSGRKPTRLSVRRKSILPHAPSVLSPEALLEMLPTVQRSDMPEFPEVPDAQRLKDFVEDVGDDLVEIFTALKSGEFRSQQGAIADLAALLERQFDKSVGDVEDKTREPTVPTVVQLLKATPAALGSVLKQIPDLLVDTLSAQQGILKYCMVHCPRVVQHFLRLEASPDALEAWHATVKANAAGLTLLWSTETAESVDDVALSPLEAAYHWLHHHTADAAKVMLLNGDLTKALFVEMENETAAARQGTLHQFRLRNLLLELQELPTFRHLRDAAQLRGLDLAVKRDVAGVTQMLYALLLSDEHLRGLLAESPELTTALAMLSKPALTTLVTSDVTTWAPFFVQTVVDNEFLLLDAVLRRTQQLPGGPGLVDALRKVLAGEAGRWVGPEDVTPAEASAPEPTAAAKQVATQIGATVHVARALNMFRLGRSRWQQTLAQRAPAPAKAKGAVAKGIYHMPWLWKTFLVGDFAVARTRVPDLTLREVKKLVLDVLIEKLKIDELEVDGEDTVGDLAPFVCDYLMAKLQNRSLVGTQLQQLFRGCEVFHSDRRVAFFAAACGIQRALGRGMLKSYLKSLGHVLFGVVKVFRPDQRLAQLVDGSCVVSTDTVLQAAANVFANCFAAQDIGLFNDRVLGLRRVPPPEPRAKGSFVDLDEAMALFVAEWQTLEAQIDEQYIAAFNKFRGTGEFIGIEEFVKIVLHVTHGSVAPRDCRLIFYDMGEDMIDLKTLLRLTQQYDLRLSINHTPIALSTADRDALRASLGTSVVLSFEDELKQLVTCWTQIRPAIDKQLESVHQNGRTKDILRRHKRAVEDSVALLTSGAEGLSAKAAWDTFRTSVASLQAAVQAQKQFSTVYVQCHVRKWMHRLKRQQRSAADDRICAEDLKVPMKPADFSRRSSGRRASGAFDAIDLDAILPARRPHHPLGDEDRAKAIASALLSTGKKIG
ncbi:hypothetical protein ACHHYP_07387 [Achlya hypogyna]|uniref:Uncharacterized protein n=1 Tax=Achlya hypogyna TaxID=1202772 RepID=A0A1V9ZM01_ACHHY|nr:hypothetical protein ACHHYP_07387 [Achlya hypogyna]